MKKIKAPVSRAPKVEPRKNGVSELREQVSMLSKSNIGVEEKLDRLTSLCEVILDYVESNTRMIDSLLQKCNGTRSQ